jgi:alkylhydroperoxidase family enzyme
MARIEPIQPKEWPPEMRDALAAMTPPVQRHPRPPTEDRPKAGAVLQTFAHHPELAKAFFTFNGHILWQSSLDPRQREILVLRVAVKRKVAFLWAQHVFEAKDAGLTDEEMSRIAFGPDAPFFDPVEGAMVRAVDELIDDGAISGDTWEVLASALSDQQLLDLVFTVGCYETTSWMFRSIGLEPDPNVPELLKRYRPPEGAS